MLTKRMTTCVKAKIALLLLIGLSLANCFQCSLDKWNRGDINISRSALSLYHHITNPCLNWRDEERNATIISYSSPSILFQSWSASGIKKIWGQNVFAIVDSTPSSRPFLVRKAGEGEFIFSWVKCFSCRNWFLAFAGVEQNWSRIAWRPLSLSRHRPCLRSPDRCLSVRKYYL